MEAPRTLPSRGQGLRDSSEHRLLLRTASQVPEEINEMTPCPGKEQLLSLPAQGGTMKPQLYPLAHHSVWNSLQSLGSWDQLDPWWPFHRLKEKVP